MQKDTDSIYDLTNTWLMRLEEFKIRDIEEFKIMQTGKKNNCHNYSMSNYTNNERKSFSN